MQVAIQTGNLRQLKEALASSCEKVRFGSEFCMYTLPTHRELHKAHTLTMDAGKSFVYITPRLADGAMDKIRKHALLLNDLGGGDVVVNDLGTLRILREMTALQPHLGRQLVYTPSRCPWKEITEKPVSIFTKRRVKRIFYQTALNYGPTIAFFRGHGAVGADIDWIPELFPQLRFLAQHQLRVSVHTTLIPVAITRKCHMARFLGEEDLERCSRPCYTKAYSMENEYLKTPLFLHGNAVFRQIEPERKLFPSLTKRGVTEIVLTMNPLTGLMTHEKLESMIQRIHI